MDTEPSDDLNTSELSPRKKVNRHGAEVRRPVAAWTSSVHAFLNHLEEAGFSGAPRVIQGEPTSQVFDSVEFIEGEVDPVRAWSEEAMAELGSLMRRLHAAGESFEPPSDSVWQEWFMRSHQPDAIFSHCDAAPWNVVSRDGLPVALIDWELAGPVDRPAELAHTGWLNARLFDDEIAEKQGLPPAQVRIRQLRAFADGYGLSSKERVVLLDRMIEVAVLSAASDAFEAGITPETVDEPWMVWGVAWRTRSAAWMIQNMEALERAMSGVSPSL